MAGRRPGREVFVDILLRAVVDCASVSLFEPGEKFDGLGDLLFRGTHWASGGLVGFRLASQASQVVPGRELLDRSADRGGGDRVEFGGQPDFEARQVFVALWEQAVVL